MRACRTRLYPHHFDTFVRCGYRLPPRPTAGCGPPRSAHRTPPRNPAVAVWIRREGSRGAPRRTAARTTRPHTADRLGPAPAFPRPRASAPPRPAPSPSLRLSLTRTCSTAGRLCQKQEARPRARAARSRTRTSYSTASATHPHYWDRRPNGGWAGPGRGIGQGRVGVEQGAGHRTTRTPPPSPPPHGGQGLGRGCRAQGEKGVLASANALGPLVVTALSNGSWSDTHAIAVPTRRSLSARNMGMNIPPRRRHRRRPPPPPARAAAAEGTIRRPVRSRVVRIHRCSRPGNRGCDRHARPWLSWSTARAQGRPCGRGRGSY